MYGWPVELAVGVIVLASLLTLMIAYAMVPQEMPVIPPVTEPAAVGRAQEPPAVPAGSPAGGL